MDSMFGISMNTILIVLVTLLAFSVGISLLVALRNRIIFMLGIRNIPRRVAQTVLIVIGLMLSTVIITAAFTTGDTVDYSITKQTYDLLGHVDTILDGEVASATGASDSSGHSISNEEYQTFLNDVQAAHLPDVDGVAGALLSPVPVIDARTDLSEANVMFAGIDAEREEPFPDIIDAHSGAVLRVGDLAPGEVYLNQEAENKLDAQAGDTLNVYVNGEERPFTVKAIVKNAGITGAVEGQAREGMVASLASVQSIVGTDRLDAILISGKGGVRDLETSRKVATEVDGLIKSTTLGLEISDTKHGLVHDAELISNFMATFFLLLGLFSIGAGLLLIVMIFVMLAAERKSEMGMARAVGTKRLHLVEMFLAEGTGYDLMSALAGVFLGVLVAFGLTTAASAIFSSFGLSFTPHATARSIAISYSLGVVLTFLTVAFSSWRVSNLNIVAAIRDTPENLTANPEAGTFRGYARSLLNAVVVLSFPVGTMLFFLRGSAFAAPKGERAITHRSAWFPMPDGLLGFPIYQLAMLITSREPVPAWPLYLSGLATLALVLGALLGLGALAIIGVIVLAFSALYLIPIGILRIVRNRRPSRLPSWLLAVGAVAPVPLLNFVLVGLQRSGERVIWGPGLWTLGCLYGGAMIAVGLSSHQAFPFALGVSLDTMGVAVLLTYFGLPARPAYTASGALLIIFWLLAAGERLNSIFGELNGDIEMFFLSGAAMVTASTFVIVYNADIFLSVVERVGGAFGSILPALRTAIAYPMANRFRTGMTLAMISIVVFALTMMSAMNLNYDKLFLADDSRGGWDVQVAENPNNPIESVQGALAQVNSPAQNDIRAEGAILATQLSLTEVTQNEPGKEPDYTDYPVHGVDSSFIQSGSVPLDKRAVGYESDQAVWQALENDPNVAIADAFTIQGGGFGGDQFTLDGIPSDTDVYDNPPVVTVRDSVSGSSRDVKIIGITAFGASNNFIGFIMGAGAWRDVFGDPGYSIHYVALKPGTDSDAVAKQIESAMVTTGAQADSLKEIAEKNNALSRNFLYLMQAFMGLGLVVGIAAIGVIAFRTVVERRQQIGMLRAIGYKKSTVALSFLIESSFVTVLGVASGTLLGLFLAYFLVTSKSFPAKDQHFYIPWVQVAFLTVITLLASLAMTWIPARQASSVPTAEALRYE